MLKPGYKTTEFAAAVLVALGSVIAAAASWMTPRYAALASAISVGSYALARGLAKNGAARPPVPPTPPTP